MNLDLFGKVALVTGSSRGLGLAIARTLSTEGCRVILNARNPIRLTEALSTICNAHAIAGDVCIASEAERIINEVIELFGRLDIVICNVGSGRSVPPGTESPDEWNRVFTLNLWSTTNVVEAARESLAFSHGSIVCISSICGLEVIPDAPVTYSAAKAALNSYVRGIARPLGKQGIRINAVASGNLIFEDSAWSHRLKDSPSSVLAMLERDVALSRFGTVDEVSRLVAFMASPCAAYATGGIWTIDGGQIRS